MTSIAAIDIYKLHEEDRIKIQTAKSNSMTMVVFDILCKHQIVTVKDLQKLAGIDTYITASRCISTLKELGILKEMNSNKRNKKYIYESYLNILRRDTITAIN